MFSGMLGLSKICQNVQFRDFYFYRRRSGGLVIEAGQVAHHLVREYRPVRIFETEFL